MTGDPLVVPTEAGLFCPVGGFHVDPWTPVERAVITHAHADHARAGSRAYLAAATGEGVLRARIGANAPVQAVPYGERLSLGDVTVSLHPAGHVLGSAQVRIEHAGQTWAVSGDYATLPNPTCAAFEPVACDVFISECTFGLPIYRWPEPVDVFRDIGEWWQSNQQRGETSIVYAYALGKAQRVLAGLDAGIGPIFVHWSVAKLNDAYAVAGVRLPACTIAEPDAVREHDGAALIVAPPIIAGSGWARRLGRVSTAFASGWMTIRGTRRRRAVQRGFVLSDHADWAGLNGAIAATSARRVTMTHGYTDVMSRWLTERGYETDVIPSRWSATGEDDEAVADAPEAAAPENGHGGA